MNPAVGSAGSVPRHRGASLEKWRSELGAGESDGINKWEAIYKAIKTPAQMRDAVAACPKKSRKLDFLKTYCNVGEHGLGLVSSNIVEHKAFSKKDDPSVGTADDLSAYCVDTLLPAIVSHPADIPDEPPLPEIPHRFTSTLGIATKQRGAGQRRSAMQCLPLYQPDRYSHAG